MSKKKKNVKIIKFQLKKLINKNIQKKLYQIEKMIISIKDKLKQKIIVLL